MSTRWTCCETMRLLLIRHAQSMANAEARIEGDGLSQLVAKDARRLRGTAQVAGIERGNGPRLAAQPLGQQPRLLAALLTQGRIELALDPRFGVGNRLGVTDQ